MATHPNTLSGKIPWTEGAWQATVHGVAKSQTQLSDFTFLERVSKIYSPFNLIIHWKVMLKLKLQYFGHLM